MTYFQEALARKDGKPVQEDLFFVLIFNYYLTNYYAPTNSI